MLNFRQHLYVEEHDFSTAPTAVASSETLPHLKINEIAVRLSQVLVTDNNTPAAPSFPGFAKMYFLTIVANNLPGSNMQLNLQGFEKVSGNDSLAIDKALFYWKRSNPSDTPPAHIHVFTALIKSKQPLREATAVLSEVFRDNSYILLAAALNNLIKGNNPLPDISNLIFNIAGIVSKYLGKTETHPLLCWYQSFTGIKAENYLPGKTERMAANRFANISLSLMISENPAGSATERTGQAQERTRM